MAGKAIRSKTGVRQLTKQMQDKYQNRPKICFLLQDWEDAYNVGSLFRVADALGGAELILCGKTPTPPDNPMIPVTSMGAHRRVPYKNFERYEEAVNSLKNDGWRLIAVEIAEGAKEYQEFNYPEKTCLVLGSEGAGVYDNLMRMVDDSVFIPMFGKGRSLNVHVAAAIVAFQANLSQK